MLLLSYATKVDYACVPCNNHCYNRRTLCVSLYASTVLVASSAYSLGSLYASNALVASSAYSLGSLFASTALVPSK